jgi:hypothetical protein
VVSYDITGDDITGASALFSHVTVGSADLRRAAQFYDALLTPLGLVRRQVVPDGGGGSAVLGITRLGTAAILRLQSSERAACQFRQWQHGCFSGLFIRRRECGV